MPYVIYYSETNLKVKQALTVTAELGEDLQKLTEFNGESTQKIHLYQFLSSVSAPKRLHFKIFMVQQCRCG